MRHLILALMLGGLLCSAGHAEERRPSSTALQAYTGQYTLADGRTLSVYQRRRGLAAQLDGHGETQLVARGDATFVSTDGAMTLAFDQCRNGVVAAVNVALAPRLAARTQDRD